MKKKLKIALLPNINKDKDFIKTKIIIEKLKSLGIEVLISNTNFKNLAETKCCFLSEEDMLSLCNIAITIGGDGTIIHTAKLLSSLKKPVLGINTGRLGFVSGLEFNNIEKLEKLVKSDFLVEKRMMLEVNLCGKNNESFLVLNDVVISRGELSRIIDINVKIDKNDIFKSRADGLIISTPTGSTAYSLSAGGPIIDLNMECILLTPICSHGLFSKSQVLSSNKEIEIPINFTENTFAHLILDGEKVIELKDFSIIKIKKASKAAQLIILDDVPIYEKLLNKLCK